MIVVIDYNVGNIQSTLKTPHFGVLTTTTILQLYNPLSPNSKKYMFHKCCINKALQK